jgi:transposase
MSNNLIIMSKIRQILNLYTQGVSKKKISEKTDVTRNTAKKYIRKFIAMDKYFYYIDSLNDTDLSAIFSNTEIEIPDKRMLDLVAYYPEVEKSLKRKGSTRLGVWLKYRAKYPDGFQETQFRMYYNKWSKRVNSSMHIEHKAGDKMYVDYAGKKMSIVDDSTGEIQEVEIFVAILGGSQLTYVEASYTQQKEEFINSCENAILYFGGAPQAIVPDNLKSAVIKSSKYEATLCEAFSDFVRHYNMTALPAGPYKPKHKALVEGAVKLIYASIYEVLHDRIFTSLDELNMAISEALEKHNDRIMKYRPYSRRQLFEDVEKQELQSLPHFKFEIKRKKGATVMKNNYVNLTEDKHYYSVPYKYIGKKVVILYTQSDVEIFCEYELIAQHKRNRKEYWYTTINEHMAARNNFMTDWTPEKFIERATMIGDDVREYIIKILEKRQHPEQSYKSCQGILSFSSKVGSDRLNKACKRAIHYNDYSYMTIKTIIERKIEQIPLESEDDEITEMPLHSNIRGGNYYK